MQGNMDASLPNDNAVPKHWIYALGGESVEASCIIAARLVRSRFSITTSNLSEGRQ
jgi:hypothetical protein